MDSWLFRNLVCPRDHGVLVADGDGLICARGHRYPVVDGVPVMLVDDAEQTIGLARASLDLAQGRLLPDPRAPELYLPSVGISDEQREGALQLHQRGSRIDPVVSYLVAATNGLMYEHLVGALREYPIPDIPLGPGHGRRLLDIGCGWGRWCVSAARLGYEVVGVDPSLGAIMAARRVAGDLGVSVRYVVGDARFLPFPPNRFDAIFSYSVLQHLSEENTRTVVAGIGRVLAPRGESVVQMPTRFGVRCLFHQFRRGFREAQGFEVRYWTLPALRQLFVARVGATRFSVDCFFGIGLQMADIGLMPSSLRAVLRSSEALKAASLSLPFLVWCADSVLVRSTPHPA